MTWWGSKKTTIPLNQKRFSTKLAIFSRWAIEKYHKFGYLIYIWSDSVEKQYFICKDPEVIVNMFILIDYMDSVRMTTCMVNCIFSRIALFWLINYNHECFSHEICYGFLKRCFMCALCFGLSKCCYCFLAPFFNLPQKFAFFIAYFITCLF